MSARKLQVIHFDCPECHLLSSVQMFVVAPQIWKCRECRFLFERWELVKYRNQACKNQGSLVVRKAA